jgi:hypothetical protein
LPGRQAFQDLTESNGAYVHVRRLARHQFNSQSLLKTS